jgi:hypothetical protein
MQMNPASLLLVMQDPRVQADYKVTDTDVFRTIESMTHRQHVYMQLVYLQLVLVQMTGLAWCAVCPPLQACGEG